MKCGEGECRVAADGHSWLWLVSNRPFEWGHEATWERAMWEACEVIRACG
jgi:hypothetical protein